MASPAAVRENGINQRKSMAWARIGDRVRAAQQRSMKSVKPKMMRLSARRVRLWGRSYAVIFRAS